MKKYITSQIYKKSPFTKFIKVKHKFLFDAYFKISRVFMECLLHVMKNIHRNTDYRIFG